MKLLLHLSNNERQNSCISISFLDIEIKELETSKNVFAVFCLVFNVT